MRFSLWPRRRQEDLDDEIQGHLEMAVRDRVDRGESPQHAGDAARRELGNAGLIKEVTRDQWGWRWLEQLLQDLRYGARMLARNPGFTAVAVLTLAPGIGVNAGIFQIFNGLALRPVELAGPGRLLSVYQDFQVTHGPLHRNVHGSVSLFSYSEYRAYRDQNHVFSGLLAYDPFVQATLGGERPMDFLGTLASCSYFAALNVRPAIGRDFVESDCTATGSGAVVILSDHMWRSAFAADPSVIGKLIRLNRIPLTIVGVAPEGFVGTEVVPSAFWVPLTMQPGLHSGTGQAQDMLADDDLSWLQLIGRVRDGISNEQVRADLTVIAARLDRRHPGAASKLTVATPTLFGRPEEHRAVVGVGAVILCAVGLILLIACANIANLLLARGAGRRKEIAVRLTVGASRGRLVRQLLTESLLLALLGAALGLILAIWSFEAALRFVLAHLPQGFPALALNVGPDFRVLGYTLALALFTAIGFGLAPALRASRVDFNSALKEEGSEWKSKQPRGSFLRRSLVGLQVAMSMILLITAGLLLRGLVRAQTIDPGFETKNIAAISFDLASQGLHAGARCRV